MADRMVVLHDGIIEQCGTPHEIYSQPRNTFVATFIGSPPMNLFPAEFVSEGGAASLKVNNLTLPLTAQTAALLKAGINTRSGKGRNIYISRNALITAPIPARRLTARWSWRNQWAMTWFCIATAAALRFRPASNMIFLSNLATG